MSEKGAFVLDADKVAHETMLPDGSAYQPVIDHFSPLGNIVAADGQIDRRVLGSIVFADLKLLAQLEDIVVPAVFELIKRRIAETDSDIVILEAIKLLDGGKMVDLCDEAWVVTATFDVQVERLRETRGMDIESIRQRLDAQSSQADKVKRADRVIRNDGTMADLYLQLDGLWADLAQQLTNN